MLRWSCSWLVVFAFAAAWVPMSSADIDDLSGGVFIAHYVPELPFCYDPPPPDGWCDVYLQHHAISSSAEQNNRVDLGPQEVKEVIWYVLSAWAEPKRWCGCEFGLGNFDPGLYGIIDWNVCCPGDYLELSSPAWPAPDTGTMFVCAGPEYVAWEGAIVPVYFFVGYAYGAAAPGVVPLDLDPQPTTDFAGWANCLQVPESFAAECLGTLGFNMDGLACHPTPISTAACCVGLICYLLPEPECTAMGGQWYPAYTSCEPNPCAPSPAQETSWGRIKAIYR